MPKRRREPLGITEIILNRYGSRSAFARKIDVSRSAMSDYLLGRAIPGGAVLARWAKELGMSEGEVYALLELERLRRRSKEAV